MTLFQYIAVTQSGTKIAGEMEAGARAIVFDHLNELGHFPVAVSEANESPASEERGLLTFHRRLSSAQVTVVTRELAMLLKSGLALDKALSLLASGYGSGRMAKALTAVRIHINDGMTLADALQMQAGYFPLVYTSMIRVAEASGTLPSVLEQIAETRERDQRLRSKILTALLYPTLLVTTSIVVIVLLLAFVVPRFKEIVMSAGDAVPTSAGLLLAASDWLHSNGTALISAIVILILLAVIFRNNHAFRIVSETFALHLPVVGHLVRTSMTVHFCRTLGTLLKNGVELSVALELCEHVVRLGPAAQAINEAQQALRKGQGFIGPLKASGLFSPVAINLLQVGEETGNLAPSALYLSQMFEEKLDVACQRLISILEPLIIILVSLVVATIIIAILSAVISVNDLAI